MRKPSASFSHPSNGPRRRTAVRRRQRPRPDRAGVDAQLLPAVGLLAREAALEPLQAPLPDAQHATPNVLADGTTLDKALTELAQVTFEPERPKRRLSLAHPVAAWRRFRTRTTAS